MLAAATIGVAAFVSVATSQKAWELTGVAVAPAAITVSPDAKLPEAVKQVELRSAERAFDRDTTSSYTAFGPSTVSVKLAEPRTVTALRFFDKAPYRVSVKALVAGSFQPVAGLESLDLSKLEARWNTLALATPVITQELRLTIEPQSTGGAGLAEIELWADGRHANLAAGASLASAEPTAIGQAMVLSSAKPQSADGAIIGGENDDVADNSFEFSVPVLPSGLARAYLAYEVSGLAHWSEAARSVNGRPSQGGYMQRPGTAWSAQVEPIASSQIAAGTNTISFSSLSGSYRLRNVRLIAEPHDGWNVIRRVESNQLGADTVLDGASTTGWRLSPTNVAEKAAAPFLLAEFAQGIALEQLRLLIAGPVTGTLSVDAFAGGAWQTVADAIPGANLAEGWNVVSLRGVTASSLRIRATGGDGPAMIAELEAGGSPVGSPDAFPQLAVTFPDAGQYYGDIAYVRGFAMPAQNKSGAARILVAGKPVASVAGVFETSVSKADLGLPADAGEWSVDVEAVFPDGTKVARKVVFNALIDAVRRDQIDASNDALFTDVVPGTARLLEHRGASLDVGPDALAKKTRILMQPLRDVDMPALDTGMINVTKGKYKGFRFLPHGQRFQKAVKVRLPFDKAMLPSGMTEADVKTFYFDPAMGKWQPLDAARVDLAKGEVESLTTHFTDMVNAVVQAPDSPENASFNPTQIKDLKVADPGARVNLIAPPATNSMGDVRLSYPIELTPGRLGMTPELGLAYNSSGGNGWVGVGWDLQMSAVMIDTRWGVPRYDADDETETYMVDGEQLAPVAHRGPLVARSAEKLFRHRVEGGFRRITRHGSSPSTYWWEVREKNGTAYFYGGDPATGAPVADSTLTDAAGNIYMWALREVRDTNGNLIRYRHQRVSDGGTREEISPVLGVELYPHTIEYTARDGETGAYLVTLTRGSELGEARRPDVNIDARGGFKRVTADLLRKIALTFNGAPVRSYEFTYKIGAFSKTLLDKVKQFDAAGQLFNEHEFSYFDEAREQNGLYKGFSSARTEWNTGADNVKGNGLLGSLDASALSGHESQSVGGHLYVGVAPVASKNVSAGAKVGFETGDTDGLLALIDINGDGLQDKVFREGGQVFYRPNRSGPNAGGGTNFGAKTPVASLPAISRESFSTTSIGPEAYAGVGYVGAFVGVNFATTDTESPIYFIDVNGDGLVDLVSNGNVLFNSLNASGDPVFTQNSADTPYPIGPAAVTAGLLTAEMQAVFDRENAANPKTDTVRRWIAPFSGTIGITGAVALIEDTSQARARYTTADGVRVAIQLNGDELWSTAIAATDYAPKTPTGTASVSVQKGDIVYFRVQSVNDGAFDQVSWAPVVTYTGVPATADADNLNPYAYDIAQDFTLLAARPTRIGMPLNGSVSITGTLNKSAPTSDSVILEVLKNGTAIASQTIPATGIGAFALNETADVLRDQFDQNGNQTQTGDTLSVRLRIDSRLDLGKFAWDTAAPLRIAYTASPDLPSGTPLPVFDAPLSADLYPESDLINPLAPWVAPADGTFTFLAEAQGGIGSLVLTAKSAGALLAKQTVTLGASQNFSVSVTAGMPVFFEFHTSDNALGAGITLRRVAQVIGNGQPDQAVPSALYFASADDILPQRYRGWNAFGYNGNLAAATQPILITSDDLTLANLREVDRDALRADLENAIRNGTQPTSNIAGFTLKVIPYQPDFAQSRLEGTDPELWASAAAASTSRQGKNFIADPSVDRFAGARAVPRKSTTEQRAVAGGANLGIGGLGVNGSVSKAFSDSKSLLDFKDMNGDQFPDVVETGLVVQFSPMTGGLETESSAIGAGPQPQQTTMEALSFGVGGSFAQTSSNAKADGDTRPSNPPTKNGDQGQMMASLGVSGNISSGTSDVDYDLIDINGDGLPDRVSADGGLNTDGSLTVQLNLGYGFAAPESWGAGKVSEGENSSESVGGSIGFNDGSFGFGGGINASDNTSGALHSLQDINGDGLLDRVRVSGKTASVIKVGFNTGSGFTQFFDWGGANGAGLANNVQHTEGGGAYVTISVCPFLVAVCVIINPGADFSSSVGRTESTIVDIDGDGHPDHLTSTSDSSISVGTNPTGRTNLLKGVKRPLGGSFEVAYDRSGNTAAHPSNRWVMSRLVVDDGQPGDGQDKMVNTYAYADGVYDRRERQFYGFRQCVETHRDVAAAEAPYRTVTRLYKTDSFYLKGLLELETLADASGHKFTETQNSYVVRNEANGSPLADPADLTAVAFPAVIRSDKRWFEGQTAAGKSTFETFEYDSFGNVTRYVDGSDQGPADDVEAVIGYHLDTASYIVGKANAITARSNGVELRRRTATLQPGTGNMLEASRFLGDGSAAVSTMSYTADGNIASMTGPTNHRGQRYALSYGYDPTVRTYVTRVQDSFGYVSTGDYDLRWGAQTLSVDINNQRISTAFDAKGRMADLTSPYQQGSGLRTIQMEYHPEAAKPWALTKHIDVDRNPGDFIETATFIDGMQRVTQTKKDHTLHTGGGASTALMAVSGRIKYDGFGRIVEQFYPVTEPLGSAGTFNAGLDSVPPIRTTYDVVNRPLLVANPANETTRFAYDFGPDRSGAQQFRTRVTDANAIPREVFRDVDNDISAVKLINNGGGQILWTSYAYDALDQITAVTDNANNITRAAYDNFGRRISIDSPDSGKTDSIFDLASNLRNTVTANLRAAGQQITYNYDFDRLASITYPQNPLNNVAYTYGAPGAPFNQANRVAVMTAEGGRLEQQYGPLGEVVKEIRTVDQEISTGPDPVFTTQFRYDTWNRLQSLTYSDGEVLDFDYDSGGMIQKITGQKQAVSYNYLNFMGYDKFEARERVEYGNGTKTDYAYNPLSRRITGLLANTATNRTFMNMAYGYDAVGNIKTLANNVQVQSASQKGGRTAYSFAYDDLHQLTAATGEWQKLPSGIADKYTLSLTYDGIHNLTRKNQRAFKQLPNGTQTPNVPLTYDYGYSYASGKPHAASLVGNRAFLYDLGGNQAGWDATDSGQNRRNVWDEDNRLQQVRDNSGQPVIFKYDDDDNRVVKRGQGGETLYVNQWYVAALGRNNKHVFAGQTRIVTKLESFPSGEGYGTGARNLTEVFQFFYHPDHLGSTGYATDTTGEVYQHLEYFPFGESWINEVTNDRRVPFRFTGKEFDEETNLYYFGARYYDPRTSVWQNPDPALASFISVRNPEHLVPNLADDWRTHLNAPGGGGVFEPKNLNAYGYVHQDPLRLTDPDGRCPICVIVVGTFIYGAIKSPGVANAPGPKDKTYPGPSNLEVLQSSIEGAMIAKTIVQQGLKTAIKEEIKDSFENKIEAATGMPVGMRPKRLCSFDASTPVHTKEGLKRIDQIAVNELVLAKDLVTGQVAWKPVEDRYVNRYADTVHIQVESPGAQTEEILSNRIHPFFVKGKGWRRADQLRRNDRIATATGNGWSTVLSRKVEEKQLLAYNLSIADFHTYFIGKAGIWVRNCDRLFKKLKGIEKDEFDKLIGKWSTNTGKKDFADYITDHADKHRKGGDVVGYLRSAADFDRNIKRAKKIDMGDGKTKYIKGGRFMIKDAEGKILTYGGVND